MVAEDPPGTGESPAEFCCLLILGINTTPVAAMGAMLNVPPLDIIIQGEARLAAWRLRNGGHWGRYSSPGHIYIEGVVKDPHLEMIIDRIIRVMSPDLTVHINMERTSVPTSMGRIWYTDGSKMSCGSGAGVYCKSPRVGKYYSLGKYA